MLCSLSTKNYPKIYRIPVPDFKTTRGKHYLSIKEVNDLLDGTIVIEEKIDGKLGSERHIVSPHSILFYEFMKWRHTIPYTRLPAYKMYFDVWLIDEQRFADLIVKKATLTILGYPMVRVIYHGKIEGYEELLKYLPKLLAMKSKYGEERIEGIIVKNYRKQLMGKIVNPEFEKEIDEGEHWMKRVKEMNRIAT